MKTLLAISDDLLALADLMDDLPEGELPSDEAGQALEAWFAELTRDSLTKVDNYCALIRELQLRAAARKEELERLQLRVRAGSANVDRLKSRLMLFMDIQGLRKIETERYKVSVCANGGHQPLRLPENPRTLPEEFQVVLTTANLEAIRAALKDGQDIPGVSLLPRGQHLRIT